MAKVVLANTKYAKMLSSLSQGELVETSTLRSFFITIGFNDEAAVSKWSECDVSAQQSYLTNTRFPVITNQAVAAPPVPDPDSRPSPITHATFGSVDVELSSVLRHLTKTNADQSLIAGLLAGPTSLWTVDRLRLSLGSLLSHMTAFPPTKPMGVPVDIDLKTYATWKDLNKQDVHPVGPMLLYKLLHQLGVKWTVYHVDGLNYIEFLRNRVMIRSFSKYIVDNLDEDPKKAAADMRTMLEGLKFKNKQIEYVFVDYRVYKFIDYLNSHYDITTNKIIEMSPRAKPPVVHTALNVYLDAVYERVKKDKIAAKDADVAIDVIARLLMGMWDDKTLDVIDVILGSEDLSLTSDLEYYLSVLEGMAKASVKVRLTKIEDEFATKCTPEEACKLLTDQRAERNRTKVSQYLNKNVGSVFGDHLPQFVDTFSKAVHITNHMRSIDCMPGEDDKVVVTGIAYGHMLPVMEKLVPIANVHYYDVEKAPNSLAVFEPGNVYRVDAKDKYLFDDTNTLKVKEKARLLYSGEKADKGDHIKLANVCRLPPKLAYLKMSLYSFETVELRERFKMLLFPEAGQKFRYVRCLKFGKVHNDELYMVLSNDQDLPLCSWGDVLGDVRSVSASVIMANFFVSMSEDRATRLCRPTSRVEPCGVTTYDLWSRLIKALPSVWHWYKMVPTEEEPYSAGCEMAGIVNLEVLNEFEGATYRDVDDDGVPDWEKSAFDKTAPIDWSTNQPATKDVVGEPKNRPNFKDGGPTPDDLYADSDPTLNVGSKPPPIFSGMTKAKPKSTRSVKTGKQSKTKK